MASKNVKRYLSRFPELNDRLGGIPAGSIVEVREYGDTGHHPSVARGLIVDAPDDLVIIVEDEAYIEDPAMRVATRHLADAGMIVLVVFNGTWGDPQTGVPGVEGATFKIEAFQTKGQVMVGVELADGVVPSRPVYTPVVTD